MRSSLLLALALCTRLALAADPAPTAVPAEPGAEAAKPAGPAVNTTRSGRPRVWVRDLAGSWITPGFLEALQEGKGLAGASRVAPVLALDVHRGGTGYRTTVTNFDHRVELGVVDVQPEAGTGRFRLALGPEAALVSDDQLSYVHFEGQRDVQGHFQELKVREPFLVKRTRLLRHYDGALEELVNRATVAGNWKDTAGKAYAFSDAGQATLPDGAFAYRLAAGRSGCDLLLAVAEDGKVTPRMGFAATGSELRLYPLVKQKGGRMQCARDPQTVLQRAAAG